MHIMQYLITKEEMKMAFGVEGLDRDDCCRPKGMHFEGIAIIPLPNSKTKCIGVRIFIFSTNALNICSSNVNVIIFTTVFVKIITSWQSNNQYNRQQLYLQHAEPTSLYEMWPKFLSRFDRVHHPFFSPFLSLNYW